LNTDLKVVNGGYFTDLAKMIISCRKLLYLSSLFFYLIISRMAQNLIAGQSLAGNETVISDVISHRRIR